MSPATTRLAALAAAPIASATLWIVGAGQARVSGAPLRELPVSQTIDVGGSPAWLAFGAGAVWVPNTRGTLSKLDPRTGRVVWTRRLTKATGPPYTPSAAVGAGSVWLVNDGADEVVRVDPESGRMLARRATEDTPARMVFAQGRAWIVNWGKGTLSPVELRTNTLRPPVQLTGLNGLGAVATADGLWVVVNDGSRGDLTRVDARTGKTLARTTVVYSSGQFPLWDVAYAAGSLWVTAPEKHIVARLDARTGKVTARVKIPTNAPVYGVASTGGGVWTASAQGAYRIDIATNTVDAVARLPAGGGGSAYRFVATGGGAVWVSDYGSGLVYQIRTG